jgi:anti-anti-sigma factor
LNSSERTIEIPKDGPLRAAGTLDTYAAAELRDALAQALGERAELAVDLAAVESCDFTTIQLLCSARRSAAELGKPFSVTALSEAVARACTALGLSPQVFSAAREE